MGFSCAVVYLGQQIKIKTLNRRDYYTETLYDDREKRNDCFEFYNQKPVCGEHKFLTL